MSPRRIGTPSVVVLAMLASPVAMNYPAAAQQPSPEQIEAMRQACRSDFISRCSGVQPGGREALQCLQRNAPQLSSECRSAVSAAAANPEPPRPVSAAPQPQQSQPTEQDQLGAVRRACTLDDFTSHCSWIQPTNPELLLCLRANAAQLSPGCQTAVGATTTTATPTPVAAPTVAAPPSPAAPTVAAPTPPAAVAAPPPASATPQAKPAGGQPSAKQISAIRTSCRSDFISRCSGAQPGSPQALQCLERNKARVSQPCQAALAALGGSANGAAVSPEPPTSAAVGSPAAPESFSVRRLAPREQIGILRACAIDTRTLCGGIPPGGGRIIACLARNASQLRPQCRAALAEVRG
jgi:hypothetical protein